MKYRLTLKLKLSLQFTLVAVGILLFFSFLVYYFSYTSQRNKFRENLLNRAKNTAILYSNFIEIDTTLLKRIHQSTLSWKNEEILISDSGLNRLYGNNIEYLTPEVLRQNTTNNAHYFTVNEKDAVCYKHTAKSPSFYVFVTAFDKYRNDKLLDLKEILFWSILFSAWLSVLLSYLFAKRAIKPISAFIMSVKSINSSRMDERLDEGDRSDEIEQLAMTFNEMLSNLEIAFKNQEDFISNASHELRTPLTVMIAEADYLAGRKPENEEYAEFTKRMLNDLRQMNFLLNSLLELAQVNNSKEITKSVIRIDEVVFMAIQNVKERYKDRKIVSSIKYPENDELLIKGNSGMLMIAIQNLIENACKFSSEEVALSIFVRNSQIILKISDMGIGIPESDLENVLKPFSRGSNALYKGGFGIGLSLVKKILELHEASITLDSVVEEGTTIEVSFDLYQEDKVND